nr:MAG: RNA-dependent RNA polymerase [Leptosphaeria biglobosa mitovirus 5]
MKKQNKLNNLNILAFKQKFQKSVKVFTIKDNIFDTLSIPLRQITYLSFGRISNLVNRVKVTSDFINLMLKIKKNHGDDFTIKWLKACYVSLQKSLGNDHLTSLRDLEPNLPLPRLINGIPACIKPRDRQLIRDGSKSMIIYWSSLFSIYRVLKCSYKLKISTITDPFKGDSRWFEALLSLETLSIYFDRLPGFRDLVNKHNLAPRRIKLLRTASPSNTVSWHGLITDATLVVSHEEMFPIVQEYLDSIKSLGWRTQWFEEKLNNLATLGMRLNPFSALKSKKSMTGEFGQFSLKEEAAGKLRVFALVDSISQNLLSPLHDFMFSVLRLIPNDGTFNQDESISRSRDKAIKSNQAFSFDLSAATDRLPVILTEKILSKIFSKRFARAWVRLMIDRDFHFSQSVRKTYSAPEKLRYSVGQPMGALSSWPALALTHHWILQYCSSLIGRRGWESNYEILGDDLVVFDSDLAIKYLEIATLLGVEINLNKSISSPDKPVFEFAKRTMFGKLNVSPIPIKQLLSNQRVSERVMNFITFLTRDLIPSRSIMGTVLSKFGSWRILNKKDEIKTPLLSILGVLHSMKVIPHRWLIESLIDPKKDLDNLKEFSIPQEMTIKLIKDCGCKIRKETSDISYPFSDEETRSEIYEDYNPEFANVIANTAYTQAKILERDLPKIIKEESLNLYIPDKIDLEEDPTLASAIEGFFDDLLYRDGEFDVGELVDSIESNKKFYYRRLDIDSALSIDDQVQRFIFNYNLTPKEQNMITDDSAPIIKIISKILGSKTSRYLSIERPS